MHSFSSLGQTASPTQPVGIPEKKRNALIASAIAILSLFAVSTDAKAVDPGQSGFWGAAAEFAVISHAGVTNTGPSVIDGNVALSPLTSITGFPPGVVTGVIHSDDPLAIQAQIDATTAYNTLAGLTPTVNLTGQDLGGLTLTAGVYHFKSSASLTGTLTLNTLSDPNAVFVFQIESTLTAEASSLVSVIGAGAAIDANVYWQIGSSTTLLSNAQFYGNIVSQTSDTLVNGATVANGKVIALNGAVTLDSNTIRAVPEPATWAMLVGGMAVLGCRTSMRRRKDRV